MKYTFYNEPCSLLSSKNMRDLHNSCEISAITYHKEINMKRSTDKFVGLMVSLLVAAVFYTFLAILGHWVIFAQTEGDFVKEIEKRSINK